MLADIYIISVSDSAIHTVAAELRLKDRIIVHTAAAVSKDVLAVSSENYGVLYPLQTLTKDNPVIPSIPVLIDGNNVATKKTLTEFATGFAENLQIANDTERLKLHVAAIFLNNFTNYVFTLLEGYLKKEELKFNILYPLIEETITRIKTNSPANLQTGPAVREDFVTIEKHKEILEGYPELKVLYNELTDCILSYYNRNTVLSSNQQ